MAKVTEATLIRKAFGALSEKGKKSWSEAGRGKIYCFSDDASLQAAGLAEIARLGWKQVENNPIAPSHYRRYRKNGADGHGADLEVSCFPDRTTLMASYLIMDRAWSGV